MIRKRLQPLSNIPSLAVRLVSALVPGRLGITWGPTVSTLVVARRRIGVREVALLMRRHGCVKLTSAAWHVGCRRKRVTGHWPTFEPAMPSAHARQKT